MVSKGSRVKKNTGSVKFILTKVLNEHANQTAKMTPKNPSTQQNMRKETCSVFEQDGCTQGWKSPQVSLCIKKLQVSATMVKCRVFQYDPETEDH